MTTEDDGAGPIIIIRRLSESPSLPEEARARLKSFINKREFTIREWFFVCRCLWALRPVRS